MGYVPSRRESLRTAELFVPLARVVSTFLLEERLPLAPPDCFPCVFLYFGCDLVACRFFFSPSMRLSRRVALLGSRLHVRHPALRHPGGTCGRRRLRRLCGARSQPGLPSTTVSIVEEMSPVARTPRVAPRPGMVHWCLHPFPCVSEWRGTF